MAISTFYPGVLDMWKTLEHCFSNCKVRMPAGNLMSVCNENTGKMKAKKEMQLSCMHLKGNVSP